jgi:hypothetical protein
VQKGNRGAAPDAERATNRVTLPAVTRRKRAETEREQLVRELQVAPLDACFANDLPDVVPEAPESELLARTHLEGVAGTIAITIAAALA